jgi:ParB-like chromosome segregation protein Spo0J
MKQEPINNIVWRKSSELKANDYNPNIVFNSELKLLERSIMLTGWVQPILIDGEDNIIDGFHRWSLSKESRRLKKKYASKVPCAVIDVPRYKAMVMTIRMNRAKGTHIALKMKDIIIELLDVHKCDRQEVADEIGATLAEVDLLYQSTIFKSKGLDKYRYSKAWVPVPEEK